MDINKSRKAKRILVMLFAFVIYSMSTICSKLASQHELLSLPYILFFCGVLLFLMVYAVLWQKVLSFMPLNKAYLCKSITLVIILVISAVVFKEAITLCNIIGAALIIAGMCVLV